MQVSSAAERFLETVIRGRSFSEPLIVGVSGPQGLGKTYLVRELLSSLGKKFPNLVIGGFSVDDFYVPHSHQLAISAHAKQEGNELLQGRGLPGTHDTELLYKTLINIRNKHPGVQIPLYDKSAYNGQGDRRSTDKWQQLTTPVDVLLVEGWFNGFKALDSHTLRNAYLTEPPSGVVQRHKLFHIEEVNDKLAEFHPIWDLFGAFVFLRTNDIANVYRWRMEQEEALVAETGSGMTSHQVVHFVDRYMPVYRLYYWRVDPPSPSLVVDINEKRQVTNIESSPSLLD